MKQHITKKQMMEVKDSVLVAMLKNDLFDSLLNQINVFNPCEEEREVTLEIMSEIINIGELVSILKNYDDVEMISSGKAWYVGVSGHINTESEELIDALWEAFKIMLE